MKGCGNLLSNRSLEKLCVLGANNAGIPRKSWLNVRVYIETTLGEWSGVSGTWL